jgi:hypothetical protein
VRCGAGSELVINVNEGLCVIRVGPQGPFPGVSVAPEGSGSTKDLQFGFDLSGLTATVKGSVLFCGTNGPRPLSVSAGFLFSAFTSEAMTQQIPFTVG